MRRPRAGRRPAAGQAPDDAEAALLDGIMDIFEAIDPMPPDLPERIRFAVALRNPEPELARLVEAELTAAGARGEEQSRTVTFDSDSLTVMIRIDPNEDGTVRVDGWLAPPQARDVELKMAEPLLARADEQGRFAFDRVPRGMAQLVVKPAGAGPGPDGASVVTPALVL